MESISWLDVVIALPILIGLVRGVMRGLVSEVTAIAAVIIGYVGARLWGQSMSAWLVTQAQWPEPVCNLVAYSLLFLGITLSLNLLGKLLSKLLKAIHLGWANRLLGAVFGAGKWAIIVLIVVYLVSQLDAQWHVLPAQLKQSSVLYEPMARIAQQMLTR